MLPEAWDVASAFLLGGSNKKDANIAHMCAAASRQMAGTCLFVCLFYQREERRIIPSLALFSSLHYIFMFCKSFCSRKGNRLAPGLQIITDQWYVGRIQSSCGFRVQFDHHLWLKAMSKQTVSRGLFIVEERASQYINPG